MRGAWEVIVEPRTKRTYIAVEKYRQTICVSDVLNPQCQTGKYDDIMVATQAMWDHMGDDSDYAVFYFENEQCYRCAWPKVLDNGMVQYDRRIEDIY